MARLIGAVIVVVIILLIVFWTKFYAKSGQQLILENAINISFDGKVDSIYHDRWDHNEMKIILSDGTTYGIYRAWESKVGLNDSLVKDKGSLQVKVYKKSGSIIILDYKKLVENFRN